MTFNPWGEINNLKDLIDVNEQLIVYGVFTNKRPLIQHQIILNIQKNEDNISLMTIVDERTGFRNLYIKVMRNIGIIENISKSEIYTGSEYLILGLQLLYLLGVKECSLKDDSFITCDEIDNFFHKKNMMEPYKFAKRIYNGYNSLISQSEIKNEPYKKVPYKLLSALRFGQTFYMIYGFKPWFDINSKREDMSKKLLDLLDKLYEIKWDDIDNVLKRGQEVIKNGNNITNNKKWRKIEKESWVIYWNTICKSWDMFKKKYYDDNPNPMSPFRSFIYYNQTDCYYFIDWLELYNYINRYVFKSEIVEIPGLVYFSEIKKILNSCKWINNDIHSLQPRILK